MAPQTTYSYDENLFNRLRLLRLKIAREKRIPAYMVFPDSTLEEIVAALPETTEEFSLIKGVGEYKLKQYANAFVEEILQYKKQQPNLNFNKIHRPRPNPGETLDLITRQSPGIAALDNFEELKSALEEKLAAYKAIAYTSDSLKDAKFDKASLNKLRKAVDSRKKYIKNICLEPYKEIEPMFKDLLSMIDEPLSAINAYISDMEDVRKDSKCSEIKLFFDKHAAGLKSLSEAVFCSKGFYDTRWENASVSTKIWQTEVLRKLQIIEKEIEFISIQYGAQAPALINKYLERCSLEDVSNLYEVMRPVIIEYTPKKDEFEAKTQLESAVESPSAIDNGSPNILHTSTGITVLLNVSGTPETIMNFIARGVREGLEISVVDKTQ